MTFKEFEESEQTRKGQQFKKKLIADCDRLENLINSKGKIELPPETYSAHLAVEMRQRGYKTPRTPANAWGVDGFIIFKK